MPEVLDGAALREWIERGADALAAVRAHLDELNVFPVPDSDTGTNVCLTMEQARRAVRAVQHEAGVGQVCVAGARGALLGARGNSGVILGQYLAGLAAALRGLAAADGAHLAAAMALAHRSARSAVARPVEGTVLSVAAAAAEAATAEAALPGGQSAARVAGAALLSARAALAMTPTQLPVLARAGVVDAGALALVTLLSALAAVLAGQPSSADGQAPPDGQGAGPPAGAAVGGQVDGEDGESFDADFEVMFVVSAPGGPEVGAELQDRMAALGESVAVVGQDGLWQVHVHTDTPRAAIDSGALGELSQVCVRRLTGAVAADGLGVVVCTAAPGLAADLARAGAVVLVNPDGRAPTGSELLRVVQDAAAPRVAVLAGSPSARQAALRWAQDAAVEDRGGAAETIGAPGVVHVLGADHEAQLVVAMAAYACADATVPALEVLTAAVDGVATALVEPPASAATPDAGELAESACAVVGRLLAAQAPAGAGPVPWPGGAAVSDADGSIVTVVLGEGVPPGVGGLVAERLERAGAEVVLLDGGQVSPAVALGVEPA